MHPVVYNKLQLTKKKYKKKRWRDCLKTESEGAHTTYSGELFRSEITLGTKE